MQLAKYEYLEQKQLVALSMNVHVCTAVLAF